MIRHEDGKWKVLSHDGSKELGTYKTLEEAKKRLQQVEIFKAIKEHLDKKKKK